MIDIQFPSLIISAVSAIAALAAALIAAINLSKSRKDQKEGLERQKKQDTIEAYIRLQDQVLNKINMYKPSEINEIVQNNRSDKYKVLSSYLAQIEHFCVGLTNGIYDYQTFYALAHDYFDNNGLLHKRIVPILNRKNCDEGKEYYGHINEVLAKMKTIRNEHEKSEYC